MGIKLKFLIVVVATLLLQSNVYAQGLGTTVGDMFANGQASFEALIRLVKAASYIIGIFLVMGSIYKFSQLGKTAGGPPVSPKTPIVMFFAGIGIFALTNSISIATATMAMGSGPGQILVTGTGGAGWTAQTTAAMTGVLTFIRLVGYIAFIRGWLMLNQSAQPNAQHGLLGRALTHIFGGVAAINVTIFAKILANTFAPGVPLPF